MATSSGTPVAMSIFSIWILVLSAIPGVLGEIIDVRADEVKMQNDSRASCGTRCLKTRRIKRTEKLVRKNSQVETTWTKK